MNKKFLCLLFSLFVALNTFAETFTVDGLNYEIISETAVKVVEMQIGEGNYPNLIDCVIPESVTYNEKTYSVTTISYKAFNHVKGLKTVTIPASVTTIENQGDYMPWNAFYNSVNIESFTVNESNEYYRSVDGVLFTKDVKTLIAYPSKKTATKYTIPKGVTTIGTYAFNGCSFSEVVLPATLTTLGYLAFYKCQNIIAVVCYAVKPPVEPVTEIWAFEHTAQETLYVPAESVKTYKEDGLWKAFKVILPITKEVVILDEKNTDTRTQLSNLDGQIVNAELNRFFYADGASWYTLCLPFNLTEEKVNNSLGMGKGCALRKLQYAEKRSEDLLYIHFATATTIEAGIPYLFRPAVDVLAPAFYEVTIKYQTNTTITTPDGLVSMTGIYAPTQVPEGKWYLGLSNTLYQPQGNVTSDGFRAYFTLPSSLNDTQGLRARVVMDGEMPTDVIDIQEDTTPPMQKIFDNGQIFILRGGHKYNLQGQVVE